jgi:hypothetical protein
MSIAVAWAKTNLSPALQAFLEPVRRSASDSTLRFDAIVDGNGVEFFRNAIAGRWRRAALPHCPISG